MSFSIDLDEGQKVRTGKHFPLVTAVVLSLLLPIQALACACCANSGAYHINFRSPEEYELDQMKRMRFSTALLYETEAGLEEDAIGITNPSRVMQ